jgi:hypothetical protein
MKEFAQRFIAWFLVFVFIFVSGTGILIYAKASGSDLAVAQDPFWGLAKRFVLDVHVVLGFLLTGLAVLYVVVRPRRRTQAEPEKRKRWLSWIASGVLAFLVTYLLANHVIDEHPVLIDDVWSTPYPASHQPDQIVLTWTGDPSTTQTVHWRSGIEVDQPAVRYRETSGAASTSWQTAEAQTSAVEDLHVINDPMIWRHVAFLEGLKPGTAYAYQVGDGTSWSEEMSFRTAPAQEEPFSFIYMGDVQEGFADWGLLREAAERHVPEAVFSIVAGDLVSNGGDRGEWDSFLHHAGEHFAHRPLVPVMGNHDDDEYGSFDNYLDLFVLPENGPADLVPEHAYTFEYGNAFFVALDSNIDPDTQTEWLEQQLAQSDAVWKFVIFHHPAYSSKKSRDNPEIREEWTPLFDEYGVDLALQGHDHAYLRSYPMCDGERVDNPANGVTYIIANAGTKYYEQDDRDYIEVGMEDLSTYQVISIDGSALTYRAYNIEGNVVDEFTIEK